MPVTVDDVRRDLRRRMEDLKIDVADVAKGIGRHPKTVRRALRGERMSRALDAIGAYLSKRERKTA